MEDLKVEYVSLDSIREYENNPRIISDEAVDGVAESIKEYGFKVPVIVSTKKVGGVTEYILITGHTRTRAARKLGMDKIPAVMADDLSEEQQKAFRIADNKVSDLSIFDNKKLLEELDGLEDLYTGFDTSELFDELLGEKDMDMDDVGGFVYEASFKSPSKEKIDKITEMWEKLNEDEPDE